MAEKSAGEWIAQGITGYWLSQALYVAARLGLADRLVAGPRTPEELAAAVGADPDALYRLLRALASHGVFAEDEAGRFGLTELAEPLRDDAADSKRALALMMGEEHFRAWGELLHSVKTGETAFEHVYGENVFSFLSRNPEQAAVFDRAMVEIHGHETEQMLAAYDLAPFGTIVDVGGGNGSVLHAALSRHPGLHGVLFDLPGVIERARAAWEGDERGERLRFEAGDFFEAVPPGADAYLLRHIVHDWDDEPARRILANVAAAMPDHARVLIAESVIPEGNEPSFAKWLDLTMMVIPGGRERTRAEYERILASAGLELTRVVPTRGEIAVVEGRRA